MFASQTFEAPREPGLLMHLMGSTVVENHASRVLDGELERVWRLWDDQTSWNQKMASVRTLTPGPLAPGSYFEARVRALPAFQTKQVEQIIEYEPPYRRTIRGIRWACVYEVGLHLTPEGKRTRCRLWSTTTLFGPLRVTSAVARRIGQKGLESAIDLVAQHLAASRVPLSTIVQSGAD
jgi:hypothetical protein